MPAPATFIPDNAPATFVPDESDSGPLLPQSPHDEAPEEHLKRRADLQDQMAYLRDERKKGDLYAKLLGAGEFAAKVTPLRGTATRLLLNQTDPAPLPPLVTPDQVKEVASYALKPAKDWLINAGVSPADLQDPVVKGAGDFAAETASGLTTPDSLSLLAMGGPGARVFQAEMIKDSPQAITAAIEANKKSGPLSAEAVKADLGAAMSIGGPLAIERGIAAPSGVPTLERTGKSLDMPEGAKPAESGTVQELQSNLDKAKVKTPEISSTPTADELVGMTPDDFKAWAVRTKYGPKSPATIASKMTEADIPKLEAWRDSLNKQVKYILDNMDSKNPDPQDFLQQGKLSFKAGRLNEIVQDFRKKNPEATATPVSESGGAEETLAGAWDKFDNTGEIQTARGLADVVEGLVVEGKAPDHLYEAVQSYRDALKDDFEMAGRGDIETAEKAFTDAVQKASGKPIEATSPKSSTKKVTVDVSPILSAKTKEESRTIGGGMMMDAKTNAEIQQIQDALKAWKEPAKPTTTSAPAENADPQIVSMGGMATADPLETAGQEGGNPDAYGIAERVREQRAKAGQVDPVEPGKGISAPDSVEHGRALKAKGEDPELSMAEFEKTKKLSSDDMALARAHGEDLAFKARRIEERFGTNSPEYQAAKKALSDWDKRSKAMQTEWHKTGMAQQGETDIDTGTFTGLERAYRDATDNDFTPDQGETAKKRAKKVREAVTDSEIAKQKLLKHVAETDARTEAEKRAFDAANKTVREAAARLAEAERKARAIDAEKDLAVKKIQEDAAKRAANAASKTVRENEIRLARKEVVKRVRQAAQERFSAERERAEAKKALDKANEELRKAAIESARQVTKDRVAKADTSKYVWTNAREYIEKGMDDFDDIRTKLATDLGMTVKQVTEALAKDKKTKFLADDLWKKQQVARRLDQQAKRWLRDTMLPGYRRALESVPKILFSLKVGFHGTVALGTHAPMVAFQPRFWSTYVRDFGKMYRMVGSRAYYEMQVQDLLRRENYTTARRAGLVNDPFVFEDYNSPDVAKYFAGLTGMGNRGYAVLKILRQDMFDQHWNQLPKTARVAEVAKAIADGVNHATGVVKVQAPKGANLALFAPRLEASRVAWLAVDPAKALATFLDWKNASESDRHFAIQQVKEKAWVAGTMFSLLALNQGFLSATGSKQKINGLPQSLGGKGFDPMESDFLKFKAAGMDVSYGNAMLAMARLPVRLAAAIMYEGKMSKIVLEDERVAKIIVDYARSQLSPFMGTVTDLAIGRDFQERPLPRAGFGLLPGRKDIPKRLRKHGVNTPYSWAEYSLEEYSPIPVSEGIKEVWGRGGLGMTDAQIKTTLKAWGVTMIMMGTGGRLNEDWTLKK